jgi:hypothetical protein
MALHPAASINQFIEMARSRTASKSGRPIVKLSIEIWIFQTIFDGETTKIKVVYLKTLYNFLVDNFFI